MRRIVYLILMAGFVPVIQAIASNCEPRNQADTRRNDLDAYTPPAGPTSGPTGNQRGAQRASRETTAGAVDAAAKCSAKLLEFSNDFQKFHDDAEKQTDTCKKADLKQIQKHKDAADAKKKQCDAAGAAAGGQEDKAKENEKKGGEGKMPEMKMPEMPAKEKEKKEDLVAKEKARQAKIAACKAAAANNLEAKKKNCESRFPYNSSYPVLDMKQKQDECKQNEIFGSQAEVNQCDLANPPSGAVPDLSTLTNNGSTVTQTTTQTNTITNTTTK